VCAYDRAGHGRSDAASGPQDGPAIARDLHALLVASGNHGPYILAGHSAGGAYVPFFAAEYPSEVAGVVLLDAMSPHAQSAGQSSENPMSTLAGALPGLARVGVARLLSSVGSNDLPADVSARRRALEATPRAASSFAEEFLRLDGILDAAGALPNLGERPLVVVTAMAGASDGWLDQQDRLATLSTNVSHLVFQDITHDGLIETVTGASAASDAIVAVVDSIRSGTRLDGSAAAAG
jgi:pimeloyl-ACP methyl ester carboxylesterase